eukprot:m.238098 g.238098  ORF g.238098 m.238098 type:complete len:210 (-) comp54348_c0_seq2:79-708(-)
MPSLSSLAREFLPNILESHRVLADRAGLLSLLFAESPRLLVPFVKLVSERKSPMLPAPHFFLRAVEALPGAVTAASDRARDQAVALADLLAHQLVNKARSGIQVLLQCQLWREAIDFVRVRANNEVEHTELFENLLVALVRSPVFPDYHQLLWSVMPSTFTVTQILTTLRTHVAPTSLTPDAPSLPLSSIKPVLIQLLQRQRSSLSASS